MDARRRQPGAQGGLALVYAAVLVVVGRANYAHLDWAWVVLAGMAGWTAVTSAAYAVPARPTRPAAGRRSRGDGGGTGVHRPVAVSGRRRQGGDAGDRDLGRRPGAGLGRRRWHGEQEAALRALIAAETETDTGGRAMEPGEMDLRALLTHEASASVPVVTPAGPVLLPGHEAQEMTAAVRAALDNVRRHCGRTARAWVLVDDEGEAVTVTIRDDGPGIPPLTEAGFDVVATVGEGAQALRAAGAARPDVVVLDLQLPDMPGWR